MHQALTKIIDIGKKRVNEESIINHSNFNYNLESKQDVLIQKFSITSENKTSFDNPESIDALFRIEYVTSTNREFTEMSLATVSSNCLIIPMYKFIPIFEKIYSCDHDNTKELIKGKLIDILFTSMSDDNPFALKSTIFRKDSDFIHKNEIKLLQLPPKYLTFNCEYKHYFDLLPEDSYNDEVTFTTRNFTCRLISEEFNLNKIFQTSFYRDTIVTLKSNAKAEDRQEYLCSLNSIVGYYGHHYLCFIKLMNASGLKTYFLHDDSMIREIGDFAKLLEHMEKFKIIPYLLVYEVTDCSRRQEYLNETNREEAKSEVCIEEIKDFEVDTHCQLNQSNKSKGTNEEQGGSNEDDSPNKSSKFSKFKQLSSSNNCKIEKLYSEELKLSQSSKQIDILKDLETSIKL